MWLWARQTEIEAIYAHTSSVGPGGNIGLGQLQQLPIAFRCYFAGTYTHPDSRIGASRSNITTMLISRLTMLRAVSELGSNQPSEQLMTAMMSPEVLTDPADTGAVTIVCPGCR